MEGQVVTYKSEKKAAKRSEREVDQLMLGVAVNDLNERHNSAKHRAACDSLRKPTTAIPLPSIDNPVYGNEPAVHYPALEDMWGADREED